MKTNDDIEGYLIELNKPFEQLEDGVWVLQDEEGHIENLVISHMPPIITFSVKLMELPDSGREKLFEHLLRLNATEMIAGAYGVTQDSVVLTDTLQSENLDFNEFQASIESLSLAVAEHYPVLRGYRDHTASDSASAGSDGPSAAAAE